MALVGLVRVTASTQMTQRQQSAFDPIRVKVFEGKASGKLSVDERSGLREALDFMRDGEMLTVREMTGSVGASCKNCSC